MPVSAVPPAASEPLRADWITIWQSELAALAVDREVHEAMERAAHLWAAAATAAATADRDPAGCAGAPPPPRPPPPLAASDGPADPAHLPANPAAPRD